MKRGIKKEVRDFDDDDEQPNLNEVSRQRMQRTFGQKAADKLTNFVGNWHYILILLGFLILWIIINTSLILAGESWDPYPYILLNLVLAAIAAIEVPIILMSQKRQEQYDRAREEYDIAVDRKSSREIREIKDQLNRIERKLER